MSAVMDSEVRVARVEVAIARQALAQRDAGLPVRDDADGCTTAFQAGYFSAATRNLAATVDRLLALIDGEASR